MEASASLGLIFGPPVGAILYGEFGFAMANYVFGMVTVLSIIIIAILIPSLINEEVEYNDLDEK